MPLFPIEFPENIALIFVLLCWLLFFIGFFFVKKGKTEDSEKKDPKSFIGIMLQGLSYGIVWSVEIKQIFPLVVPQMYLRITLAAISLFLAIFSDALLISAFRHLGKQWSLSAKLIEGHKLVTDGPYKVVRHPIYTAMFGMLLATGIALTQWAALPLAIIVHLVGASIRIRSEEKLLRAQFGAEFEEYAKNVPAIFPGF